MRPRDRRLVDLLSAPHQVAVLAPTPYRSERPAKRPSKGIDHPTPVTEGWAKREARAHLVRKIQARRWASLRSAHPTVPSKLAHSGLSGEKRGLRFSRCAARPSRTSG